jgi:SAM-dependent methyltransferase
MCLEQRRSHEREKYLSLMRKGNYGSSNHGKNAYDIVMRYTPSLIVDFGCGDNKFIKGLISKASSLSTMISKDISGIGIDFAHTSADLIEPMHKTSLPDSVADVVTSFDALEHLLPEEVEDVLREMCRVGVSGGGFVFSICTRPSNILSMGENLHPTVENMDWWLDKIGNFGYPEFTGNYVTGSWR